MSLQPYILTMITMLVIVQLILYMVLICKMRANYLMKNIKECYSETYDDVELGLQ
jgi:hypothetical protein